MTAMQKECTMTLDRDDKEHIDLRIEHFMTAVLPKAFENHIKDCPVKLNLKIAKWTIIGLAAGIGISAGNIGLGTLIKFLNLT